MSDSDTDFDVVVIGSGPGGYVAAIRAAQLGLKTACVERESLGGICLNWGCIPTKALLRSVEVLELFHRAKEFGVTLEGEVKADFPAMIKRSRDVADRISKGVAFLLRKNKIEHVAGTARLLPRPGPWQPHQIEVALTAGGSRVVKTRHVILATGARAKSLPGIELDGERIIEYRKAMTLPAQPKRLAVIGAGAIGVEFASFYRGLGTEVSIIEFLPRLVPNEDPEVSKELHRAFEKRGLQLFVGHKVTSAKNLGDRVAVTIEPAAGGAARTLEVDVLLCAVGITPNTEQLGLEAHGVALDRGFIKVDDRLACGDGLWAIGDVIGRGLAHTASAEGVYVAEEIAGHPTRAVDYSAIPACTYCHPEIASVGLTEEKAKEAGIPIKVGRFPWRPLGKAMAAGESTGFVKVLWHGETGALVGAHMIGPAVTDLVAELTLAKTTEVNADSLVYTVHAHPTFAEAIKEATEDALGHPIHL
ncbi:MAG TPA: dihydrolipoyl dehydrogenase [Kofleriaceae bacterium]|jgi:dihydrolipoamide dehydrogenase|nr:dihydrolipoyl dehydrogenase [Kofleriaceae bacterium]